MIPRSAALALAMTLLAAAASAQPSAESLRMDTASVMLPGKVFRPPADTLRPRPADPWLAFDKVQHTVVSALWTVGTQYALVNKAGMDERDALPLAVVSAGAVGVAKELYDRRRSPTGFFSRRDLVADAVGIALAAGFILL